MEFGKECACTEQFFGALRLALPRFNSELDNMARRQGFQ